MRAVDGSCDLRLTRCYAVAPAELWESVCDLDRWLSPPPGVTVREVEPGRVLELDWRPQGEEPSPVRIELTPHDGGTRLVVDHSRVKAMRGMLYLRVWTARLETLA